MVEEGVTLNALHIEKTLTNSMKGVKYLNLVFKKLSPFSETQGKIVYLNFVNACFPCQMGTNYNKIRPKSLKGYNAE